MDNPTKTLAFKVLANEDKIDEKLEKVINDDLSLSVESHSYEELDFNIPRDFTIRDNSALKLLTVNIVETYKNIRKDFFFEETQKPRRPLTIPEEGKRKILNGSCGEQWKR